MISPKLRYFVFSICLLFSNFIWAQNEITFLIKDVDHNPIEGAVVFINNSDSEKISDDSGIVIYQLNDGSYTVFSYAADYLDNIKQIEVASENKNVEIIHKASVFWSTSPANAPIGVGEEVLQNYL